MDQVQELSDALPMPKQPSFHVEINQCGCRYVLNYDPRFNEYRLTGMINFSTIWRKLDISSKRCMILQIEFC